MSPFVSRRKCRQLGFDIDEALEEVSSTWPYSRSRARSGLAGLASSDSKEASSDHSSVKRRETGQCIGVGNCCCSQVAARVGVMHHHIRLS